jgi:hypothetical protein
MQLLFTALPSKKSHSIAYDPDIQQQQLLQHEQLQLQMQQQQQQQKTLLNANTTMPDIFSNRTYFSSTNMFSRVASGVIGCSSCSLRKPQNKGYGIGVLRSGGA